MAFYKANSDMLTLLENLEESVQKSEMNEIFYDKSLHKKQCERR